MSTLILNDHPIRFQVNAPGTLMVVRRDPRNDGFDIVTRTVVCEITKAQMIQISTVEPNVSQHDKAHQFDKAWQAIFEATAGATDGCSLVEAVQVLIRQRDDARKENERVKELEQNITRIQDERAGSFARLSKAVGGTSLTEYQPEIDLEIEAAIKALRAKIADYFKAKKERLTAQANAIPVIEQPTPKSTGGDS